MAKILIIDDDEAMREILRLRLENAYTVIDTGDPEAAFAIALEQKPDVILLDLSMGKVSGFELCKAFTSCTFTSHIPVLIVTGADSRNAAFCKELGATGFFQKPLDFARLSNQLEFHCHPDKKDRRSEARAQLHVILKLKGKDRNGAEFELKTSTEDISANGFQSACTPDLDEGANVEVWLCNGNEHYIGAARVARKSNNDASHPLYGFRLQDKTSKWVVQ